MNKILLIRHDKTIQSERGLVSGDNNDSSLSVNGLIEILERLKFLTRGIFHPEIILVSRWKRTYQTAVEIFPEMRKKFLIRSSLDEIDKGFNCVFPFPPEWTDVTVAEWDMKHNNVSNLQERLMFKYPSGVCINNYIDIVVAEFEYVMNEFFGKNICIFGHNGSIKSILLYILNMPKEDYFNLRVDYGECSEISYNEGCCILKIKNS